MFENLELFAFAVQEKSQITTGIARLDDINMTLLPPGVIGVGEGMGDQRGQVAISDIIYPTLANFRHAMKFIMVELKLVCVLCCRWFWCWCVMNSMGVDGIGGPHACSLHTPKMLSL